MYRKVQSRRTARITVVVAVSTGAIVGCDSRKEHASVDRGKVCFRSALDAFATIESEDDAGPVQLAADKPLTIHVKSDECMSACDRHSKQNCALHREADQLILTSKFSWEEPDDGSCTLQCIVNVATCKSEPLPAGHYTIVHGDQRMELTIPSEVEDDCWL